MFLVALTSHDSDGPIAGLLLNSSQWLTDVAVFVLSCRKNPPKPRRVWQLLGRLLPNPT